MWSGDSQALGGNMPTRMQVFRSKPLKPFTATADFRFQPPSSFHHVIDTSKKLNNPQFVGAILRAAMSETLLVAYRKRFLDGLPGAVNMQRADRRIRANATVSKQLRNDLMMALSNLDATK